MRRAICLPILGLLVIVPLIASAQTISTSIAGVTVSNGDRKGGISVRLSDAKEGGTIFDSDTSSTRGVYNLSTFGVQPGVTGLWVIDGGGEWKSRATFVVLGPSAGGVRRAKVEDIAFTNIQQQQAFTAEEAASLLAGLQETAAIEVKAGALTEAAAKQKLTAESAQILAKVPDLEPGSPEAQQVARQALAQIDRRAVSKPILEEGDLMDVTNQPEFRDMSRRNRSQADYQKYLSNPDSMPIDLLLQGESSHRLQKEVESQMAPGMNRYKLYVEEGGMPVLLDPREPLTVKKGIQIPDTTFKRWLQANPEARTYLFYRKMLDEKLLPESELKRIEEILDEKMVLVVQPNG